MTMILENQGMTFFIIVLVVSAVGAASLVLRDWFAPETRRLRDRLAEDFDADKKETKTGSPLFKNLDRVVLAPAERSAAKPAAQQPSFNERIQELLDQASLPLTPWQIVLISACLGIMLGAGLTWWRGPLLGVAAAGLGCAAPWWIAWVRRANRQETMVRALPSVFDLMARAIRAGQSVPQALQAVSDSFSGPIAAEFQRCQKLLNLGMAPEVAFGELAQRTNILEMRIFTMALVIQGQVGGSLAETMDRLSAMIRARLSLRNQVRTLTAEGRLQGWTLVVLPFVLFAAMMVINRSYAEALLDHPKLIAAAIFSMCVGMLWIRRIVNFEA
jgi:tight adherence protein B